MTATLYASVLHLDRQATRKLKITDPYSLHRVVYSLFEDVRNDLEKAAAVSSGIVYADQGGDFKGRKILLLSDRQPAPKVEGLYGQVDTKEIPADFLGADLYRFKTKVNPTRRENASRRLAPVKGREAISNWFCERAQKSWGFTVLRESLQVDSIEVLRFKGKNEHRITIGQATLQGVLQVTDRKTFTDSFACGIGRSRAFGCGLLQIVPQTFNPFV